MTEIANAHHLTILNPTTPNVTLKGTIATSTPIANYITYQPGLPPFYKALTTAVFAPSSATFTIENKAEIISNSTAETNAGIILAGPASLTNKNFIEGANGIFALAEKGDKIINKGTIIGTLGTGAYFYNAGNVDNAGLIAGNAYGIYIVGSGNIKNTGTVVGKTGISIYYGPGQIYNAGTIEGTTGYGVILRGTITNASSGAISGTTGIYLRGGSDVKNQGVISGKAYGLYFLTSGTVHNSGLIAGATGISLYYGHGRVENTGTISAATGYGVIIHGAITNASTATITGHIGVDLLANSTAANYGLITGATTGVAIAKTVDGSTANYATTLQNSGTIHGATNGIAIYAPAGPTPATYSVNLYNTGGAVISGGLYGINDESASNLLVNILNKGVIDTPSGKDAILMQGGNLTNSGFILNAATGIYAANNATIANTGLIFAYNTGIDLNGGGTIQNSGGINGDSTGVLVQSEGAVINNQNGGTIAGNTVGIALGAASGVTIYDAGLIAGSTDAILASGSTSNALTLAPTATIQGAVKLFGDLTLAAGPTAGTIALSNFTHIRNLTIAQNATWNATGAITTNLTNNGALNLAPASSVTLGGPLQGTGAITIGANLYLGSTAAAGEQILFTTTSQQLSLADPSAFAATIQNFAPTDTIDLTGISLSAINGEHLHQNTLTLVTPGKNIYLTFAATSTFTNETFSLFADSTGAGAAGLGITLSPPTMPFQPPRQIDAPSATTLPAYTAPPAQPLTQAAPATPSSWAPTQILNPSSPPAPVITLHP